MKPTIESGRSLELGRLHYLAFIHAELRINRAAAANMSAWFSTDSTLYWSGMHILFVSHDHRVLCEPSVEPVLLYRAQSDSRHTILGTIYWRDQRYRVITDWPATSAERGLHLYPAYQRRFRTGPRPTCWYAIIESDIYDARWGPPPSEIP